jgi:cation diffusion facilitator CzcD-associated flavoprotein CzcO
VPGPRRISLIIVGAGFGGLAAAIELRRHGFSDVTLLERADGLGGTWRYNDYPGCACDVPSQLYSFSYATRRDWPRLCSPRAEILGYLEKVGDEHGVDRCLETGVDVTECRWDAGSARWSVSSADGRRWEADALIIATGQLHQPAVPAIPGRFDGHSFHSARWDHSVDLRGKRVAVIGTGASAVQFVPEIAEEAERLYVFQRTGNWFMPRRNRAYPAALRAVIQYVPGVQALRRRFIYYYAESLTMMIRNPRTSGGSIVFYEEAQAAYIRQALVELGARGAVAVEVRRQVEAASDREVQARFAGTAWTQCDSWYRDEGARIVANWPGYMTEYAERVRELDASEFTFTPSEPSINEVAGPKLGWRDR